jgi:outer membrane protein TolC
VKYGLAQVDEGVAALHARADSKRRDVAYSVVQAYLGAVLAQRVADVTEQSYTTVQQHLTQAQALLRQGQIPARSGR